ncbi:hypothetical protein FACS1894199_13880 [Bacteroidia bacterium]|nr:hypothetical protein FACS1894199_13880 [Bacteroidia bacterium]
MIKEVAEKISSYNLFNNLLPGILFVFIVSELTKFNLILENSLIGAFVYYFIGLVINRLGSLVIEPVLKRVNFVKFSDYKDYIIASKTDSKIDLLSEENNMFRTFIALFASVLLTISYDKIADYFCLPNKNTAIVLIVGLLILFLFSYRKQTKFIKKRVEKQTNQPI